MLVEIFTPGVHGRHFVISLPSILCQWLQRLREGSCRSRRRGRSSGALSSRTIPISILALAAKDRCCCEPLLRLPVELGLWNPDVTALFARTFFGIEFYGSDCHSARPEISATCGWNKTLLSLRFLLGTVKSARTAPAVWKEPGLCWVRHAAIVMIRIVRSTIGSRIQEEI